MGSKTGAVKLKKKILNKKNVNCTYGFQVTLAVKNPPANAGGMRDMESIPGSGRSLAGEHGSPLQYSCMENPMDKGAWQAIVHRVTKSCTQAKWFSIHTWQG